MGIRFYLLLAKSLIELGLYINCFCVMGSQKRNDFTVLVLMSTYNGELYIREQLDSILNQEGVEVYLLVRDDGSKDTTCNILSEYSSQFANVDWISGENVGFIRSFSILVKMALDYKITPDYFAFADQDDIWFPEKLKKACQALESKENSKPLLFSCNSIRIDANGKVLGLFHEGTTPIYRRGNVLVYGTEQGCSMTFNRKALEIYAAHEPQLAWHDRWMYHICYYLGDVIYEHTPLFYYRIHGNNALACSNVSYGNVKTSILFRKIRTFILMVSNPPLQKHMEMAKEFYTCFHGEIAKNDKVLFCRFLSYRHNLYSKLVLMFSKDFVFPFSSGLKYRRLYILFNKL